MKLSKTNKIRFNIILIALIFGSVSWIVDAIIDYFFFFNTSFQNVLLLHLTPHMQFERIMIIVTFLLFGILITQLVLSQRKVKKNLEESEERFRLVADFAKDWEYWISKDRDLNYVSPSSERITGYKPVEFIKNKNLLVEIVHPDDREEFLKHTTDSLCNSDLESFELRVNTKNKETIWIEHSCQSVYDSRGKYIGHRVSNRDITRRKLAEELILNSRHELEMLVKERTTELEEINKELLLENEERKRIEKVISKQNEFLNTTINSLTHPFYVIDVKDYSIILANSATNDFISTANSKCFAVMHNRDTPCGEGHNCPLEIVKKTKKETTVEHTHLDKYGNEYVFEVHGHPIFDSDGNVIQMIEYSIDITERKRLEKKLIQRNSEIKALLEQSPFPLGIYSESGELLEINQEWKNLFESNNNGSTYKSLLENEYLIASGYMPEIRRILKEGKRFKTEPILLEKENRMVVFDIYDIKDESGNVDRIVCQIEDRTDEMRREDVNRELNLQKRISSAVLDILEEDRKRVSKELHDQIGQKLILAKLGIELLQEETGEKNPKLDEAKKQIIGISKDIKSIILSLHPAELDNYGLIDAIQLMVGHFSEMTGVKVSINYYGKASNINKKLELNIYRIIQEALNNISKHAKAKNVNIELRFGGGLIKGLVKDDGIGFDSNKLETGTLVDVGYGLISMRERTKISGGEFSLNSQTGKGTEIQFRIPLIETKNETG